MKHLRDVTIVLFVILIAILSFSCSHKPISGCLTGAFLADKPSKQDITNFKDEYSKKPFLTMVFIDWENFINKKVIEDVYSQDCVLFVTWEPWYAVGKKGIDYDELLSGEWDKYIMDFANKLKDINKPVFLRFAHEMNGNWYPWSGTKIGKDKFMATYRYVKDAFDKIEISNVRWVFSINWEDIPQKNNHFSQYYPGDDYVDFIGIDGYNWGNTKSWSRWISFGEIFETRYNEVVNNFEKPVLISEFSSTSSGGDKTVWIKEAMTDIKRLKNIKGFVLFNVDKETDWSFSLEKTSGKELKLQLRDSYFKDG
jgi:beta-mannanase